MRDAAAEPPSQRLERALEAFLQHAESGSGDASRLLDQNQDLRELLEPMLAGSLVADVAASPETGVPGESVLGDFRLVRELGRGGMGIVYEAWQRSLDRSVALKVLSPALAASPSAIARFRREAAAVGKLRHPGIVEVHGFGSDADRHWFAMGLVDGEPLTTCAARFRAPEQAVGLVVQVLDALQHAHGSGLVHRDVKPGNVIVRADGSAVLTDFGLAHDAELPSVTTEGSFLGTLEYASPEQAQGGAVDVRTDVWSVGVLLHELLAGERPFARANATATLRAILTEDPPPLRGRCPAVSSDLAAIGQRALQKEPARRYPTALAFLADLRAWQSGGLVSARAPGPFERALRWTRREPWRATTAAVLVLGAPLLTATLAYLWTNAPRIEAAVIAEAAAKREEVLGFAWWQLHERDGEAGLKVLDALTDDPSDIEVAVTRAMLQNRLGRKEAARTTLQPFAGDTVELVRGLVDDHVRPAERLDGKVLDAFDCFVRGTIAMEHATLGGAADKALVRRALECASLAVGLAPAPRINYLLLWGTIAKHAADAAAIEGAERALARHFPDSRVATECRISILAESAPDRALELIERLRTQGIADAELHNNRGVAFEKLGRYPDAEAAYRAAIERKADYGLAWTNLGGVLRLQKRPQQATEALRKATQYAPRTARTWNMLGITLRTGGDLVEARAAFARAIALRPDYAVALYNLGNLSLAEGLTEQAIELFGKASAADPKYVQAVANLGNALKQAGRKQEALVEYVRATQIAPNDLIPHHNVARTALELGLAELALKASQRTCEIAKGSADAWWIHAEALLAQTHVDADQALAAARQAESLGKNPEVERRIVLARALEANGERPAAIAVLEAVQRDAKAAADHAFAAAMELLGQLRAAK